MRELATVGYEAATVPAFLRALGTAGVELLVDVRAVARSRRPGFSKTQLAANLAGSGIGYVHLRGLGTPAEGRAAARAGRYEVLQDIYAAHLESAAAQDDLSELATLVHSGRSICILCYERDPAHCHRSMVADAVAATVPLRVRHLIPDAEQGGDG